MSETVSIEIWPLVKIAQSESTFTVYFYNGFAYGHVSALDLYNYLKLRIEHDQIINDRENYLQSLKADHSVLLNNKIEKLYKEYCASTDFYLNEIKKAIQLFPFPCSMEVEKIIDETTKKEIKIS
jgi:hypothetical protein